MCWFKRKANQNSVRNDVINKTPPEPSLEDDVVEVVWNADKTEFGAVFCKNGIFSYGIMRLYYEEEHYGYYWHPIGHGGASFYDTKEKAIQAAESYLQGKEW